MELVSHDITLPTERTKLYIHGIGDVHYEATGADVSKFRRDIAKIAKADKNKNERHLWVGMGDMANGISPKDKRFDATAVAPRFARYVGNNLHKRVATAVADDLQPISGLCLGYLRGNHEDGVLRFDHYDPAEEVCERLNVNYLGYSAIIRLVIGLETSTHVTSLLLYVHHGTGASRSKGGKMNMLYAMRDRVDADIYICGHVHEPLTFADVKLSANRRGAMRETATQKIFINSGTYMKAHSSDKQEPQVPGEFNDALKTNIEVDYAEKAGYNPAVIGHMGCSFQYKQKAGQRWAYRLVGEDFPVSPLDSYVAVCRILNGEGADKHGDAWMTRCDYVDLWKSFTHFCRWAWPFGYAADRDSGESHLTHCAARLLLVLEREQRK